MAMSKEVLWNLITARHPEWKEEEADFTAAGLRKFFDTVFNAGHDLGVENGKALADRDRPKTLFDDLLGDLKGKG